MSELNASIRVGIHVQNTGFGRTLYRIRMLLRAVIGLAATGALWLLRPLVPSEVVGVGGIALLAWWALEVLIISPASGGDSDSDSAKAPDADGAAPVTPADTAIPR